MSTFTDTSALLALLDRDDQNHSCADHAWREMVAADEEFVCSNYVLVELVALTQARLGMDAVRSLHDSILPLVRTFRLEAEAHATAVAALLAANCRRLSLVDCASFETMRRLGIRRVFTFDRHFAGQGFEVIP